MGVVVIVRCMVILGALLGCVAAQAGEPVQVGGYQFEPFVEGKGGISPAFVDFLNASQETYEFRFTEIPARRRYELMRTGKIDMILFEMPVWGWKDENIATDTTEPLLKGQEVFIARHGQWDMATPPAQRLKAKMALALGYHYAFARYNADQAYLKTHYKVMFADSQAKILRHLLAGSVDIGVVNDLFLAHVIGADPALDARVMQLPPADQLYSLPVMVRQGGAISAADMTLLLNRLIKTGALQRFFARENLAEFLCYPVPD